MLCKLKIYVSHRLGYSHSWETFSMDPYRLRNRVRAPELRGGEKFLSFLNFKHDFISIHVTFVRSLLSSEVLWFFPGSCPRAELLSLPGSPRLHGSSDGPSECQPGPTAAEPHPHGSPHLKCKTPVGPRLCRFTKASLNWDFNLQFWIRVPLMAAEDTREDLIENEPFSCADETTVDEKTWNWWDSDYLLPPHPLMCKHQIYIFCLFFFCSGGTHFALFVTTIRGSASVREQTTLDHKSDPASH